jgi:hypothetical protein
MPTLPFGEYRPDLSDLDGAHTRSLLNVLPQGDGYGPIRDIAALTDALPATCRGYFYARGTDNTITVFAGTSTKLYMLDNTSLTWSDVSASAGTYTTLAADAQWQFAQFGSIVIATQANDDVQAFTLGSSVEFGDLAGSPPRAAYVTVVGSFVVLSGLAANPFRVHWSAIGSAIGWTAGTNQSDFQDLADGGIVRQVLGGEVGIIMQDLGLRRMIYSPGSEYIFAIDQIGKDIGLLHPYAATATGDKIFYLSPKGFMQSDPAGSMKPIGAERVDKHFFDTYDAGAPGLVICAADPRAHVVLWVYRSAGSSDALFDAALAYNWLLDRWTPLTITGEFITSLAQPGLTIEGLDAIAPGAMDVLDTADNGGEVQIEVASTASLTTGDYKTISAVGGTTEANGTWEITVDDATHFTLNGSVYANAYTSGGIVGGSADAMETPWDSISTATLPKLSVANSSHKLAFFSGATKEAILETPEHSLDGQRMQVNGFHPITDAPTVYGRISKRETLQNSITFTNEAAMRLGFVGVIRSTVYSRAKIRIPADTDWTYASGVRPLAQPDGAAIQ